MRILIADDNDSDRQILRYYLQLQGGEVTEARNGAEGLRLALDIRPDLIISDALMPEVDGFQFLRQARQSPELLGTPFIFYSSVYTGDNDMRLALELGADAFIAKPKDPVEFWQEVQSTLASGLASRKERRDNILQEDALFLKRYCAVVSDQLQETVCDLHECEALFQETFEQAAVGMAHLTPDGTFLRWNRRFREISGYADASLQQLSLCTLIHPRDQHDQACSLVQLLDGSDSRIRAEKELIGPDGSTTWINLTISLVLTSSAVPSYFIVVIEDISARKGIEEERNSALELAQKARDQYSALLDSVFDGVIITDDQGGVRMNPAAETLLGAAGGNLPTLNTAIENRALAEHIAGCLRSGQSPAPLELVLTSPKNGRVRTVQALTSAATDSQGRSIGTITILHDITAERASDQLKSEFIATAAHELRTPLTAMVGYAELLQSIDLSPTLQAEALATILAKGEKLERLISELLDLSRIESGRLITLEPVTLELGAHLKRLALQFQRENPGYPLEWVTPQEPLPVYGDPDKIEQVVDNLLGNAMKFSNPGQRIGLDVRRSDGRALVCVTDEGIGMTAEQQERVFEKFYRADASDTGRPGLGLGMTLSRNIILAHRGDIWIESTPGQGSRFYFSLPLHG